jgi:hypothetical protein
MHTWQAVVVRVLEEGLKLVWNGSLHLLQLPEAGGEKALDAEQRRASSSRTYDPHSRQWSVTRGAWWRPYNVHVRTFLQLRGYGMELPAKQRCAPT